MKYPKEYAKEIGVDGGYFIIPFEGRELKVIASNGMLWDHVSAIGFISLLGCVGLIWN